MRYKILLITLLITAIGVGLFTTTRVLAQNTTDNQNPMSSLVQKIVDKFGLNKDEVQAVFDQDRTERQAEMEKNRAKREAEMETKFKTELDQDVKDGKITQAQADLILAKREELKTKRQSEMQNTQNMTEEERKANMETKKTEMDTERKALEEWAKTNNIDMKYLMMGFGGRGGHGGPKGMNPPPESNQ